MIHLIFNKFLCTSDNIVYCIFCSKCGVLYFAETGRRLGDRFREHLNDIKDKHIEKSDISALLNIPVMMPMLLVCYIRVIPCQINQFEEIFQHDHLRFSSFCSI